MYFMTNVQVDGTQWEYFGKQPWVYVSKVFHFTLCRVQIPMLRRPSCLLVSTYCLLISNGLTVKWKRQHSKDFA